MKYNFNAYIVFLLASCMVIVLRPPFGISFERVFSLIGAIVLTILLGYTWEEKSK